MVLRNAIDCIKGADAGPVGKIHLFGEIGFQAKSSNVQMTADAAPLDHCHLDLDMAFFCIIDALTYGSGIWSRGRSAPKVPSTISPGLKVLLPLGPQMSW